MANKNRAWRPDDGFYKALREETDKILEEGYSDNEMVQLFAASWLARQSVTLPDGMMPQSVTHSNQSDSHREVADLKSAQTDAEIEQIQGEIAELKGGMRQLLDALNIVRSEIKVLRQESGFI